MGVRGTGMIISTLSEEIRRARDFLGPIEECWYCAEKDSRVVAIRFLEPVEWSRTNSSISASCSISTRYELQARASNTQNYRKGKNWWAQPKMSSNNTVQWCVLPNSTSLVSCIHITGYHKRALIFSVSEHRRHKPIYSSETNKSPADINSRHFYLGSPTRLHVRL
jgi:hypothetical protein